MRPIPTPTFTKTAGVLLDLKVSSYTLTNMARYSLEATSYGVKIDLLKHHNSFDACTLREFSAHLLALATALDTVAA